MPTAVCGQMCQPSSAADWKPAIKTQATPAAATIVGKIAAACTPRAGDGAPGSPVERL